jgi:uncharacterized repeat protein (TIGR01451 family)
MKLHFVKAAIITALLFCANAINAQPFNIVSHNVIDSCGGGITGRIVLNQSNPNLSFTTYWGDGTSSAGIITNITGSNYHVYTAPGTYTVKHILFNGTSAIDSVQFSVTETHCAFVMIRFYSDANSNCTWDSQEGSPFSQFLVEIDSAGVKKNITVFGSSYMIRVGTGIPYTFKVLGMPPGFSSLCPASGTITQSFSNSITPSYVDFGAQCTSGSFDFSISKLKGRYRPTSFSWVEMSATNFACSPSGATVTLNLSPKFTIHSIQPTPASVSGQTVTWNLSNIQSMATTGFIVYLNAGPNVSIGDTICASASITPITGDLTPANNTNSRCDSVVASWDPNEKEVYPQGMIVGGTKLDYTIHFENLGSDTAFNIHVLDTLSTYLVPETFQMTASSHRAMPVILDGPNNSKILKFDFPDIKLADSSHPEANKGFVKFSINTKAPLAPATLITNRAGIYFDTNPVVMTNEVANWTPVSVKEVLNQNNVSIYPNPVTDELTIKTNGKLYQAAKLVNNLGQTLTEQTLTGNETRMKIGSVPPGIYFIHLRGAEGTTVEKIQKQ